MKFSIPLLCLLIVQGIAIAQDPAELSERRKAWETQRTEAQANVNKLYFEELEQLKKNFVKAGNIEAARAVDETIKGEKKSDNEPEALTKMRLVRDKSLQKALKPLDKQYWQDLKKLRGDFQKQGSLAGIEATDAEIKKVLAAYKKPEAPEKKAEIAKEKDETEFKGFEMEFVLIGNPNNEADNTGYGAVPYTYRIGKYEVSEAMIDAYNKRSREAKINKNTRGADKPATSVRPHQAALFVNWLNTSRGHQAAYKFKNGNFEPWDKDDAWQLGGENLLRHKDAYYFLPSENEWYKAAYYDPQANDGEGHYWDYATGSNKLPTPVANGTDPYTAVHSQPEKTGPADITTAGGLSPYGTMAQSGNVSEFGESAFDGTSKCFGKPRFMRGACFGPGFWGQPHFMKSGSRDDTIFPGYAWALLGFRVAAVTE
jgi:sulfatase modifying factor 1